MLFAQDDKSQVDVVSREHRKIMEYKTIQLTHGSGIAIITLNRPEKRNAISFQLVEELLAALDEIEQSSSQVVILTGQGKAFCAGLDLGRIEVAPGQDSRRKREGFGSHGALVSPSL